MHAKGGGGRGEVTFKCHCYTYYHEVAGEDLANGAVQSRDDCYSTSIVTTEIPFAGHSRPTTADNNSTVIPPRLPDLPILDDTILFIYRVLIEHIPCDAIIEDVIQLCEDLGELYQIENFLNPTRPTGSNLEFAVLYFTTENGAQEAIRELNDLTLVTQLERKTLRVRYSTNIIILTFDRPLPTDVSHNRIKKEVMSLSGTYVLLIPKFTNFNFF